jgi:general secretion pathway protein L
MRMISALMIEVWRWWLGEFLALLPALPFHRYLPQRRVLLLRAHSSETELAVVRGGTVEWMAQIAHPASAGEASGLRAGLEANSRGLAGAAMAVLPREAVLQAQLCLPQAAARHLGDAASYQIERLSPFPPANTLYAIGASKSDGPDEIAADILIVRRDFVEEIEARAGALGLGAIAFAVEAEEPGGLQRIAFAGRQAPSAARPWSTRVLVAAAALLAATLLLAPIVSKTMALAAIEDEAQRLKPQAGEAAKLRGTRDKQLKLLAKAATLRRATPAPLAILAKLSAALDDGSFLTELRLEGTALTISGLSADASALAQRLGGVPEFKAVKFSGPVTREPQAARDRFTLQLELAPPP